MVSRTFRNAAVFQILASKILIVRQGATMLFRFMIIFGLVLSLSLPVQAAPLYPLPDDQIAAAALEFKEHNYKNAREIALTAPQSAIRDFLLGMAAYKEEEWTEAATHLSRAADSFPLLADYALYNEASALYRLDRFSAALAPLQRLARDFPTSPLTRSAQILSADILFENKDFTAARAAYQKFIEKFPSGTDSLSATYKSAACLEKLGDNAGAITALRTIWLKYPASAIAVKAEDDLRRLSVTGESRWNRTAPTSYCGAA